MNDDIKPSDPGLQQPSNSNQDFTQQPSAEASTPAGEPGNHQPTHSSDDNDDSIEPPAVNVQRTNVTQLAAACWNGDLQTVKMLLAQGADPNGLSPHNRTPLYFVTHRSPRANRSAIVQSLLDAGADVDKRCDDENNTPLMNAISQIRDKDVIQLLINNGASKSLKNIREEVPKSLAEKHHIVLMDAETKVAVVCTYFRLMMLTFDLFRKFQTLRQSKNSLKT